MKNSSQIRSLLNVASGIRDLFEEFSDTSSLSDANHHLSFTFQKDVAVEESDRLIRL